MPWESIGDVAIEETGTWLSFAQRFAIRYIEYVCGKPPEGCKLGLMDIDHDHGSYPGLGVWYEYEYPQDYIHNTESTLEVLNKSVDWYSLKKHSEEIEIQEDDE